MKRNELRETILGKALAHVPFDGWTEKALLAGARDAGLTRAEVLRAFPGGGIDALDLFLRRADGRMVAALEAHGLEDLRIHEKVALAVRLRFEDNAPHREAIRRGLSLLALPPHAPLAMKSLYRTVDAIWLAIGDRSTDHNWYTKRLLLAGVYSSTLLYWLNDESADFADTWAFLDRRIADVLKVPKAIARVQAAAENLPNPFRMAARARER